MNDSHIAVTTVEPNETKAVVKPYTASPRVELHGGTVACGFCGNTRFRRSRLRFHDIRELLLLRCPVRCTRCGQRQYNSYAVAGLALPQKTHGPRLAKGSETWKSWTEQNISGQHFSQPKSTAIDPRAEQLDAPVPRPARPAPAAQTPPRGDDSIW